MESVNGNGRAPMVRSFHLKNVGQFEDLSFEVKHVVVVRGPNESGKTTIYNSACSVFENAFDSSLKRKGAEKAEIDVKLDDGTVFHRTITDKGSYGSTEKPDGGKVKGKEETYLKSMASGWGLDPLRLVLAKKADRLEFLLKIFPMEFTPEEVQTAAGVKSPVPYSLSDLDSLVAGREEKRKDAKKVVAEKEKTLANLTKSEIPEDTDWIAAEKEASDELADKRQGLESDLAQLDTDQDNAKAAALQAKNDKVEDIRKRFQVELDAAEREFQDQRDSIQSDHGWKREAKRTAAQPEIEKLVAIVQNAKTKADEQLRNQGVRDVIAKMREELKSDVRQVAIYQEHIDSLRELRKTKMKEIPIDGVTIGPDGDIYVDGMSFDTQVNRAEQFKVAMQICARATGALPFFVVDGGEFLDDESLDWVAEGVKAAGYQMLITQVRPGQKELTIENR